MKQPLAFLAFLLPTPLAAQNPNIFDVFYDQNTAHCHTLYADTLWVGGKGVLMKRIAPSGELAEIWDGSNSPLRQDVVNITPQPGTRRLWLALYDEGGAILKDGDTWKSWTAKEVMGDSGQFAPQVHRIGVDAAGRAWAADQSNRRMVQFENGTWLPSGLSQSEVGYISRFINDPQGGLWWVNYEGIHGYVNGMLTHRTVSGTQICDAQFRADGQLIALTSDGRVLRFLPSGATVLVAKWDDGSAVYCATLGLDNTGTVYVADDYRLQKLTSTGWEEYLWNDLFNFYPPHYMAVDAYGNVWVSEYWNSYLYRFSNGQYEVIRSGIAGRYDLRSDASGEHIWSVGLDFVSRRHVQSGVDTQFDIIPLNTFLMYHMVPAGAAGQMWLATSEGLYHFDGANWALIPDPTPNAPQNLYAIGTGAEGEVVGVSTWNTDSFIKIYRPATQKWEQYPMGQNGVPNIWWPPFREANGRLWYGGAKTVTSYYKSQWTVLTPPEGNNFWFRAAATPDGTVWACRRDSIYRYDGTDWSFAQKIPCGGNVQFVNNNIADLFVDSRGWLWATKDCGTASAYNGLEWKHLNASNTNLPDHLGLGDIAEDAAGDLWIGSAPAVRLRTKTLVRAAEPAPAASIPLRVWPNPATGDFTVDLPPGASGWLELSNAQGRLLSRTLIAEGADRQVQVARQNLPAGLYFVRFMENTGKQQVQKVIFE